MKNVLPIIVALASVATTLAVQPTEAKLFSKKDKSAKTQAPAGQTVTTPSGLQYQDMVAGNGPSPKQGQRVSVHYTGWLKSNGQKFDSSLDRGKPFEFTLGAGEVIRGWDEGVASMKVGGKRKLIVPPQLGYGQRGTPGGPIPPNAVLVFDVELLGCK